MTINLCKGHWQIPLDGVARPKSAFITPFSLYYSWVMRFGIKNALATLQRMVDRLLDGWQDFTCAYLDDITIYSGKLEEHLSQLETVLDCLGQARMTVRPDKCHVGVAEIQYLGHWVGGGSNDLSRSWWKQLEWLATSAGL